MATYGQLVQFGPYFNGGLICTLKVYHYIVGTTTLKDVYIDREKGSTAAQPVASDANGIVSFYADGIYKFRIDGATDGSTYTTLYTYDKWAVGDQSAASGEGAALASASTLVLGTDGDFFHVTGSTGPITAISGTQTRVTLVFDSVPTLTHSGSLILAQGVDYTTLANDTFVFINDGAGVWREVSRNSSTTGREAQGSPIINGSMEVWQRGTSFAGPANGSLTADRWGWGTSGSGVVTITRSTNVPTVSDADYLFNYSLDVDVTTADASLGSTDIYFVFQKIEGYNWRQFAQRAFTVSFWVRDTVTGAHAVAFVNSGFDRSYVAVYTINAADTWEYKTVTVSASPSAGTWNYTTGVGLMIKFVLAAGSDGNTTPGIWQTGNFSNVSSTVNSMSSASNFFRVAGIKLEVGTVASPIQFRAFSDELALAKRYYQKSFNYSQTPATNLGLSFGPEIQYATKAGAVTQSFWIRLGTSLRSPTFTVTTYNPSAANAEVRNTTDDTDCTATTASTGYTEQLFAIAYTGAAGMAVGEAMAIHWTADAEL